MLQQAIGLSIILGFLSTELLGLFTGGLISAGYLAFYVEPVSYTHLDVYKRQTHAAGQFQCKAADHEGSNHQDE